MTGRELGVDRRTGLVLADGEPLVVGSRHHDVVAHVSYDTERMAGLVRLAELERGERFIADGPLLQLELALELVARTWQWAEFVMDPDPTKAQTHHDLHATAKAEPPASTPAPKVLLARTAAEEVRGDSVVFRLRFDGTVPAFNDAVRRANKRQVIDRLRRAAAAGQGGRLLSRKP